MGYYDDHSTRSKRPRGRASIVWAAVLGVIIGAVIVLVAMPMLVQSGWLNGADQSASTSLPGEDGTVETGPNETRNVKVDVTTNVTDIVEKVQHAVVGVVNIQGGNFWQSDTEMEAGTGSGVIYKKDGNTAYVVTNYHVIQQASEVEISLYDGTRIPAEIRGADVFTDLAVLVVEGEQVNDLIDTVATFGNSDDAKIGEPVIAIGNPLGLEFSGSVTQGILSGKERAIPVDLDGDGSPDWQADVMQTDAAINPGNSGGALFNLDGQVIGINSMKIAQSAVEGLGFSIPTDTVIPVIKDLETQGKVSRPVMGILNPQPLANVDSYHRRETLNLPDDISSGVVVTEVAPNSPAQDAGLEQLDVIIELDGTQINDTIDLRKYLYNEKNVGDSLDVTFYRSGQQQSTTLTLTSDEL
ncbi:S1C family serine protease [Aureibacillus halotolerans]|nr:trypsin-like peptidase domain-containing protein [Aureibacillus halotolerans]